MGKLYSGEGGGLWVHLIGGYWHGKWEAGQQLGTQYDWLGEHISFSLFGFELETRTKLWKVVTH